LTSENRALLQRELNQSFARAYEYETKLYAEHAAATGIAVTTPEAAPQPVPLVSEIEARAAETLDEDAYYAAFSAHTLPYWARRGR